MEVVSSNSDAEIARNDALQGLRWRLREIAANLMRIARGAGKPHGVGEQVYAVLEGYRAYHRSEEHTSELLSLMRNSYAVSCLNKKTRHPGTAARNTLGVYLLYNLKTT